MANLDDTEANGSPLYPVTLDAQRPCMALGMPESIYEGLINNIDELRDAILNCDYSGLIIDAETDKRYYLFKKNLAPVAEAADYLEQANRTAKLIGSKVATLMHQMEIEDVTNEGEYWRIVIDLHKQWQNSFRVPMGAESRDYGWHDNDVTLQWNEDKGVLRIKTGTLHDLLRETARSIRRLLKSF